MDEKLEVQLRENSSHPSPSLQNMQQYPYDSHPANGRRPPPLSESEVHGPDGQTSMSQHTHPLPPIHQFEGQSMQSQQPHYVAGPMNGAPMQQHPAHFAPDQYPYANGGMQPSPMPSNIAANGQNGVMRYALPPQNPLDPRQISGGRHKKEIKRRTKTGCLTCRKRRIKCDEAQPSCRNCQKSKRECLGYDPIFKQQSGPAPIQPAPTASAAPGSKSATTSTLANPYHQPQAYSSTGGAFLPAAGGDATYEYTTSLDPALSGSDVSLAMASRSNLQPERTVKHLSMEDLFALGGIAPHYQKREGPHLLSATAHEEIASFYNFYFAPGLDRLLETSWYSSQGFAQLQRDSELLNFVLQCVDMYKAKGDDIEAQQHLPSLEARLVWQLACMPRTASQAVTNGGVAADYVRAHLLSRLDTLENLLTGQFLDADRVPAPPQQHEDPLEYNKLLFWHQLGRFVSTHDDQADPTAMKEINDALVAMRGILGMLENRDVLYSIAIARHIGGRMVEFHPSRHLVASSNDANDDVNKLKVAHHFVESEDQRGTTQVIQRICSMSLRSWALQKA